MNADLKTTGILNIQAAKVEAFISYFIKEPFLGIFNFDTL